MEKQKVNSSRKAVRLFQLITILGFILCLGSIFTFIIMNVALGSTPSIEAIYWQRLFVSTITNMLILPGLVLIVIGVVALSCLHYGFFKYRLVTIVQILVAIIVINSIHISVLAYKVTAIATQQYESSTLIKDYITIKSKEDMFGAVNMILLLSCLILGVISVTQKSVSKN